MIIISPLPLRSRHTARRSLSRRANRARRLFCAGNLPWPQAIPTRASRATIKCRLARVVKLVDTRDLKFLGSASGHAGSSPALGTIRIDPRPNADDTAVYRCQTADCKLPAGGSALRTLSCLLFAALLAGCLPIGIRGSNLPNYAGATLKGNAYHPVTHRAV
jgi:hypothetical protein